MQVISIFTQNNFMISGYLLHRIWCSCNQGRTHTVVKKKSHEIYQNYIPRSTPNHERDSDISIHLFVLILQHQKRLFDYDAHTDSSSHFSIQNDPVKMLPIIVSRWIGWAVAEMLDLYLATAHSWSTDLPYSRFSYTQAISSNLHTKCLYFMTLDML